MVLDHGHARRNNQVRGLTSQHCPLARYLHQMKNPINDQLLKILWLMHDQHGLQVQDHLAESPLRRGFYSMTIHPESSWISFLRMNLTNLSELH